MTDKTEVVRIRVISTLQPWDKLQTMIDAIHLSRAREQSPSVITVPISTSDEILLTCISDLNKRLFKLEEDHAEAKKKLEELKQR